MITASLSQPDQDQLVLLIEKCKFLNEMHHRSTLMKRLPESLRPHIPAASCLRTFLTGVVGTCARHPGGIHALRQAIGWLEGHTYALQAIEDFLTARGIIDATATATAQDDSVTTSGFDTSEIDRQIEEALQRKANLAACGLPTIDADQDILVLKRQRRQGGQLRSGDRLGDRYVLHKQCGVGGFGRVWDAVDTESQTRVAIKVLHGHLAGSVLQRDRFFRGARIASKIAHNAVIHIRERKAEDDGFYFFVMDFITGGDLRQAVMDKRVPKENIMPLLLTVADAVAEVHKRGYVHRDIKPTNILLTEGSAPKLTDFDLVAAPDTTGGTQTGLGMGTLYFAPPELLHNAADTDARVDVFGLGMTAVFMLYGHDLPLDVWSDRKRFMNALPCSQHLRDVLWRAVALNRSERYPDAASLCEALRNVESNMAACDCQWCSKTAEIWRRPRFTASSHHCSRSLARHGGGAADHGIQCKQLEETLPRSAMIMPWPTMSRATVLSFSAGFMISRVTTGNGTANRGTSSRRGAAPPRLATTTPWSTTPRSAKSFFWADMTTLALAIVGRGTATHGTLSSSRRNPPRLAMTTP